MTDAYEPGTPVGVYLQKTREQQGLSIQEVSERLKFTVRQVQALEASQYGALSGRTFARGFVRVYARLLGISDAELLAQLETELPIEAAPVERPVLRRAVIPTGRRSSPWVKVAIILLVLIVGALGLFRWLQVSHFTQPPTPENQLLLESELPAPVSASNPLGSTISASAAQASSSVSASAVSAAASAPLVIRLNGPSWIEVFDAKNKTLYSAMGNAKEPIQINGLAPFRVKIGKASAVSLFYAGKPVDLKPYTRGEVVRVTLPLSH